MSGWGAGILATALQAGIMGAWLLLAVTLLRPDGRWRARLLFLGLFQFVAPPLLVAPTPRPTLDVRLDLGLDTPLMAGTLPPVDGVAILVILQLAGLAVGLGVLSRSAWLLHGNLGRARRVERGTIHDLLREVAAEQGVPTPRLYRTRQGGPGAIGLFRPAVLLPDHLVRTLQHQALRMVIRHEVAHIARRDPLVGALRHLIRAAWWFHPVAWILARAHRAATEDACDDVVTARHEPEAYCRALLRAAGTPAPMAVGIGGHPLGRRFRRIMRGRPRSPLGLPLEPRVAGWILAAVAAAALVAAPTRIVAFDSLADRPSVDTHRTVIRHDIVVRHVVR